jgi:hypothetical protein
MIMIAHKFSLLRELLWAATLAIGFGTLWFALALWLGTSIQQARGGKSPPQEDLVVKSNGTPLIRSIPRENLSLTTYRDLNGRAQDAPDRNDLITSIYMPGEHGTPGFFFSRLGWEERLRVFINEREPTVNWFFVHDGKPMGAGYFVGYEHTSNRQVGFIGLSGFRTRSVPTADWIPVRGELVRANSIWSSAPVYGFSGRGGRVVQPEPWDLPPRLVYVPSGNFLRMVDLAARTVTTVFETAEPIEAPGIPMLSSWSTGHPMKEKPILVRTRQQIHILDHKHNIIKVFAIPNEVDRQSPVQWYEIGNGQAIADFIRPGSTGEADNVTKRMVYRIADNGAILDRFEVTLHNRNRLLNGQTQTVVLALGLPVPAIKFVIDLLIAVYQTQSYPAALSALIRDSGLSLIAVFALSLILAIMAWRRSRSFGLSKREQIAWMAFVLLFGVPAYVGFLLYRRWPIRQPCPNCHARAPRDCTACAECGTRFPDPSLKGIEIFA